MQVGIVLKRIGQVLLALVKLNSSFMVKFSLARILFVTPILLLAAGITMLIIVGADENFKPCPSTKRSFHTVKEKRKTVTVYTTFFELLRPNHESQSHNVLPRAVLSKLHDVF